jgi:hypothetical protein
MRTLVVLVCSLALAFAAIGAQQEKKKEAKPAPKKPAQATQRAKPGGGAPKAGGPHQPTMRHREALRQRRLKETVRTKRMLLRDNQ